LPLSSRPARHGELRGDQVATGGLQVGRICFHPAGRDEILFRSAEIFLKRDLAEHASRLYPDGP